MKQTIPIIPAILLLIGCYAGACLRPAMDARTVQWSTLIVQAKLTSIGTPVTLKFAPSTQPSRNDAQSDNARSCRYQLYGFQVTSILDGRTSDAIQVIEFIPATSGDNALCDKNAAKDLIGKSFLLLLRPEADLDWESQPSQNDPRDANLHALHAFALIHLDPVDELGPDGLADIKSLIADTRRADSQFSAEQARLQATTLSTAADDTESEQAEKALLEMGPKALPVLRETFQFAPDTGKSQLKKVIDALTPPPLVSAVQ